MNDDMSQRTKSDALDVSRPKNVSESMDFEEMESIMWRKDRGHWWTNSRRTTAWKWVLVVLTGIFIGIMGYLVAIVTLALTNYKFNTCNDMISKGQWNSAFFSFIFFCLFYALIAGLLCWVEPAAAGSGIPEIKAYLNGINLNKVVRIRVLIVKVIGVCFSCAAGLPLGKEGPMIHAGSIVGAAVSQGKTITFGFDTSWTKFQDLRNDRSKRDFVTFGAAAGVAAAFSAPIGGILFTLEEGASFWSTTLTFRAFFCAMMTQLTLNLLYSGFKLGVDHANGLFAFGLFDDFTGYSTYELLIFTVMGAVGGVMGAFFNYLVKKATLYRKEHEYDNVMWKRLVELLCVTFIMSLIAFFFPLMWRKCTAIPTNTADWTTQEINLLDELVPFQCGDNYYNQLASLYFVPADTAMQQLYHFKEVGGTNYATFDTGALLLFFIPYYLLATFTAGTLVPAGLFVPTLLAGAAYGRMVGHILNCAFPGYVTDAGTYALIGASALLGGMSRMTIAGTIIVLEACGNSEYLLPLMLTFAAARYAGNAINEPLYDMMIQVKHLPFLEGSLKTLGLLNYHPVAELMSQPVITLNEINRVSAVHHILSTKSHNGFPVIGKNGHLRGFILRKTLCNIMKLKAFSVPLNSSNVDGNNTIQLAPAATVFHETLERNYPHYAKIEDISLTAQEMNCWLDIRPYMDTAPYAINASSSVQRCYRFFRTMGLRHLIVLDGDHRVTGIITRQDITEHRLEHHWFHEGDNMQKFISVDPMEPGTVYENTGLLSGDDLSGDGNGSDGLDYLPPPTMSAFEMSTRSPTDSAPGAGTATFSPMMMPTINPMGAGGDVQQTVAAPTTAGPPSRNKERATKEPKSMKPK